MTVNEQGTQSSVVFTPGRIGPLTLRNRIIKAATFEGRTPDALVTDELIAFHAEVAAGGAAMTTVAYCAVQPEGRTQGGQIWMRPDAVPGLRKLTDAVHAQGAAAQAQIGHAGIVANSTSTGLPALGPTNRWDPAKAKFSRSATVDDIARIARSHGTAAELALESGFDSVEVHLGHNYFASSFLSPKINKRKDEYGGSFENRSKVALNSLRAVRDRVGDRMAVTAKMNMDDGVAGGFWIEEAVRLAQLLEAEGLVDALQMTVGSSPLNPMYLFRGEAPIREMAALMPPVRKLGLKVVGKYMLHSYPYEPLFMLEQARQIRAAVKIPLILLGGVTDLAGMNTAMESGFEFVAMGRALLREPDLVRKLQADNATRSLCIHCNKCMPTNFFNTHCVLRPESPSMPTMLAMPTMAAAGEGAMVP
ncbi:NADH:flavin oxidoreductase [Rhodococcus sp. ARC_M6]|uniref:NADH:flavin oxidoreductase n=1 Tax=Rhodococcus sp. ARC_M6 TaxID=2928852 RepID=UPI001FB32802|nr:NADH:flavin oxidoreductase [Rhodococcus sp. ARC_M6]MCJ0903697.1 NADH:flavin oxidoreductase [Rhodococcus sp. ARC_M6]